MRESRIDLPTCYEPVSRRSDSWPFVRSGKVDFVHSCDRSQSARGRGYSSGSGHRGATKGRDDWGYATFARVGPAGSQGESVQLSKAGEASSAGDRSRVIGFARAGVDGGI